MECYKERIDAVVNGFKFSDVELAKHSSIKTDYYRVSYITPGKQKFYADYVTLNSARRKYSKLKEIKENTKIQILRVTQLYEVIEES